MMKIRRVGGAKMEKDKKTCDETCTCGCQEGKECTCEEENCSCDCEEEDCHCDENCCDEKHSCDDHDKDSKCDCSK